LDHHDEDETDHDLNGYCAHLPLLVIGVIYVAAEVPRKRRKRLLVMMQLISMAVKVLATNYSVSRL
jgi:hypothetical protein